MKTIDKLFDGPTYNDHTGAPSMGRKWGAALIVAYVMMTLGGMLLAGWLDPKKSAAMLPFYQFGVPSLATVIIGVLGFVYSGKAKAQAAEAQAKTTTGTTPPATANTPAQPSSAAPPTADPATAKTTTAMGDSTKAADKPQGAS